MLGSLRIRSDPPILQGVSGISALQLLLVEHPEAWVGAMGPDLVYVPMPEGLPVVGHPVLRGRWTLDHVAAVDRPKLSAAWRYRVATEEPKVTVRLVTGDLATFYAFDLVQSHGVSIVVAIGADGADLTAAVGQATPPVAPRYCQTRRDIAGRIIQADEAAAVVLGWPGHDLTQRGEPLSYIHPDDHRVIIDNWLATLSEPGRSHRCRVRTVRADDTWMWVEVTNRNRLDVPEEAFVLSDMLDISEEMTAHEAVRAQEQLLRRLAEALPLGVLQLDAHRRILYRNNYLTCILGEHDPTDIDALFGSVRQDDRPLLDTAIEDALTAGRDDDITVRVASLEPPDDRFVRVITKALRAEDGGASGVIACITDVTEVMVQRSQLERRATFDTLTGCHNRSSILGCLNAELRATSGNKGTAVIFIDLDHFKAVNDGHGHAVGDEMLKTTVDVLHSAIRDGDSVGRLGGDEFLVLCRDIAEPAPAMNVAERIVDRLHQSEPMPIKVSLGVAWTPGGSLDADALVARADQAMYVSKRGGLSRPQLFGEANSPV